MNQFNKLNPNYIVWLQERNRSKKTIALYWQLLEQFLTFKKVINTESIRSFLKENITIYQPNSLKTFCQALSSYGKFQKLGLAWEQINGIVPKAMPQLFSVLSISDLELLKSVKSERSKLNYQRNNLIFDFLFYSGIRVSELVNIKHSDWDSKNETLRVHGKGNKVRYVFLPPFLVENFKNNSENYLFTNLNNKPLCPLVIRQIISQRLKKVRMEKKITPHSFRRSFATLLHNQGAKLTTIQHLLGHDSITTTEKYIQTDRDTLYADYSKLWKPTENYALQK